MSELTPRDDDKKRVSEILKRVDQLIKTKDFEGATREIEHAREIDPRNVYIEAYHSRLATLIEESKKDKDVAETRRRVEEAEQKQRDEERKKREEEQRVADLVRIQRQNLERKHKEDEEEKRRKNEEDERRKQEEAQKHPPQKPHGAAKEQAKIFVVDDDEKLLNLVKETIEDEGFDVQAFLTTDEAYKVLKTETPDLILSDINLETSTMGGFTFFEKIRELDHLQDVPFVFLTGLSDEVLVRTGKEMGIDDYITKPFSPQSLIAIIKGKIKRYRQMKSGRKNP